MQFDSEVGQFKLESQFAQHKSECEQCQQHDDDKPATLALLCLEGSWLWKNENTVPAERGQIVRSEYWRPKAQVKAAMRYKGEA